MTTHGIGMPSDLAAHDTAPPLPPWLKGFLVTSKTASDVRRAGEKVRCGSTRTTTLSSRTTTSRPASMVKPGTTEVTVGRESPHPRMSRKCVRALRPDTTTVNVGLAEGARASSLKGRRDTFSFFRSASRSATIGHS